MTTSLSAHPLISVADVEASSRWYRAVLGEVSGHGGPDYERIVVDDVLVLQLHHRGVDHHHGPIGNPDGPVGGGVALWFTVARDFDAAVDRARVASAVVLRDVHVNPNSGRRELWLHDPDGYLVVLAEA